MFDFIRDLLARARPASDEDAVRLLDSVADTWAAFGSGRQLTLIVPLEGYVQLVPYVGTKYRGLRIELAEQATRLDAEVEP